MRALLAQLVVAFTLLGIAAAGAQNEPTQAAPTAPERIQIGLSTDRISIRSDFSGADLTIFGSVDNADPFLARQGRYDVVVVLEGPPRATVVRRKDRVLGMWINTQSETFVNVPASYSVSTTRALQDMADPAMYRQLSLGIETIHLQPADSLDSARTIEEFGRALRDRKRQTGLYNERIGGVQFLSQNLFRATVSLAPNVPLGTHRARAFLFKSGAFIGESSASLAIYKAGFEQSVFEAAHQYSLLYGLFAVALAMLTGWLGSIVFRRE
jgi:uncharacterized protein (TIGR02186 family)